MQSTGYSRMGVCLMYIYMVIVSFPVFEMPSKQRYFVFID